MGDCTLIWVIDLSILNLHHIEGARQSNISGCQWDGRVDYRDIIQM
jgi:hypothetical protein